MTSAESSELDKPHNRSDKYPQSVIVDFRKLSLETLRAYAARYRIRIRPSATANELASVTAHHFACLSVDEELVLSRFGECLESASVLGSGSHSLPTFRATEETAEAPEDLDDDESDEREDDDMLAKPGEQVAAKVTLIDENGSWILASVVSCNRRAGTYQVQDEDDETKVIELPVSRIRRLHDEQDDSAQDLQKGDHVLAIFPETTSFYRAVISKTPKRNATGHIYEVVLKFEDDEDDAGRTPHRRVSIRYVLREHRPCAVTTRNRSGATSHELSTMGNRRHPAMLTHMSPSHARSNAKDSQNALIPPQPFPLPSASGDKQLSHIAGGVGQSDATILHVMQASPT